MDLIGRGPSTNTTFREPERGVAEELRTPIVPVKVAPGRSEGVLGPTYHGDGNPLSELEMQKSALKLKNEGKEKVRVEAQPEEPTEQERLEHEATHIPFAHLCESCVEAKSKQDHEKKNPEAGKDSVGVPYPIVQLDFMFLQGKDTPALVAICSWTRMSVVIPVSRKQTERKTVEKVLRWVHSIGHLDEVGFVGDSEEAMVSLVAAIVETRRKMNRKTHDQNNKPYQKGRTARIERFIQTVRNQTVCLVRAAEKKLGIEIPEGHAMWAWGLCHASWLLNRYHRHAAIGSTPYESPLPRKDCTVWRVCVCTQETGKERYCKLDWRYLFRQERSGFTSGRSRRWNSCHRISTKDRYRMEKGTSTEAECNTMESQEAQRNVREATVTSTSISQHYRRG